MNKYIWIALNITIISFITLLIYCVKLENDLNKLRIEVNKAGGFCLDVKNQLGIE